MDKKRFNYGTISEMVDDPTLREKMALRANELMRQPEFNELGVPSTQEIFNTCVNMLAIGYVQALVDMETGALKMMSDEEVTERKEGERVN